MKALVRYTAIGAAGALVCAACIATSVALAQSTVSTLAQSPASIISLRAAPNAASPLVTISEASFAEAPANFRSFASADVGAGTAVQELTLQFASATQLTSIKSTRDFQVEQGGSCALDTLYSAGANCTVLVRFTPQGPGRRLGNLAITHTASESVFAVGLGGFGYAPVVSFTPAQITTVPGTYPASVGLLSGAKNMTVDGGDILYIADTGNNTIREIDSSGALVTPALSPIATPVSLAVDNFGIIYTTNTGSTYYFSIYYPWGSQTAFGYTHTGGTCTPGTPCAFSTVGMSNPANASMDTNNNLFMEEGTKGALEMPVGSISGGSGAFNLWYLSDQFAYSSGSAAAFAVDANDNLYTYYNFGTSTCYILQEPLYYAENSPTATRVAGGVKCGFSGDGGQARSAEIGSTVGQIAFDLAGNLYFSDTSNQRVRRIDASTGIISTIAGTGTAGYTGDGGPATAAALSSPAGVAVDSQGQVYIISSAATGQVVRKLQTTGRLNVGNQQSGTTSIAHLVTVANTGNSGLTITKTVMTGVNPGDFSIDPNSTTCNLTAGGTLAAGQACKIGVLFTPTATGARSAYFTLLDNTVTNANTIVFVGTGTAAPALAITSPGVNASVVSGASVHFAASVTSKSSPTPTGTIRFSVDGKAIGSLVALSSGTASAVVKETTVGTHTLTVVYSGDHTYIPAGPVSRTFTVTGAASSPVKPQ